jgi:predicted protein tyrosine phosphatase
MALLSIKTQQCPFTPTGLTAPLFGRVLFNKLYCLFNRFRHLRPAGEGFVRYCIMNKPKILFVCSRNKWRSPTAEEIYKRHPQISVKSGGLSTKGNHQVNEKDIEWADLIIFMENGHRAKLMAQYRGSMKFPYTEVLNIPDEYQYMDDDLVEILKVQVDYLLKKHFGIEPLFPPDR